MTKKELISEVSKRTGYTKKDIAPVVDTIFETIKDTLIAGDKVVIPSFGSYEVKERAAKMARHPQTGEPITVEAHNAPTFKFSPKVKQAVRDEI